MTQNTLVQNMLQNTYVIALRHGIDESLEKIVDAVRTLDEASIPGDGGRRVYKGRRILVQYPEAQKNFRKSLAVLLHMYV